MKIRRTSIRWWGNNIAWTAREIQLISGWQNKVKYSFCRFYKSVDKPLRIRIKGLKEPVLCRPGTSDPAVLWDTFGNQYHLPPTELETGGVLMDLGANVGYTTLDLASRFPDSTIIAVEMDRDNFTIARDNLQSIKSRIILINAAIWFEDGAVRYSGDAAWSQRIMFDCDELKDAIQARNVEAVSVNTVLRMHAIDEISFAKVDIEGAEAMLFSKNLEWLAKVRKLLVELHPPADFVQLSEVLEDHGFQVQKMSRHPSCLFAFKTQ